MCPNQLRVKAIYFPSQSYMFLKYKQKVYEFKKSV